MSALMWALGMGLAAMIGGALGASFVKERGRKVLPVVIVLTLLCGLAIGYGLNGELDAIEATSH
jgi:uncharacterized membrane protein YfcA